MSLRDPKQSPQSPLSANPNAFSTASFGDTIHQAVLQDVFGPNQQRNHVGMSQLPYCILKTYNDLTKKPKNPPTYEVAWRLFRGSALHNALVKALFRHRKSLAQYKYIHSEREVNLQVGSRTLTGHYDHLANLRGQKTLVDFKFVRSIKPIEAPLQHHLDQISLYAYAFNKENPTPVGQMALVYIDAQSFTSKEFVQTPNFYRIPTLLAKFESIMRHIESKVPPNKPFPDPNVSWECRLCPYERDCWSHVPRSPRPWSVGSFSASRPFKKNPYFSRRSPYDSRPTP